MGHCNVLHQAPPDLSGTRYRHQAHLISSVICAWVVAMSFDAIAPDEGGKRSRFRTRFQRFGIEVNRSDRFEIEVMRACSIHRSDAGGRRHAIGFMSARAG
jgi:hypothetical protein